MIDLGRLSLLILVTLGGLAVSVWVFRPAFRGAAAAQRDLGTHRLAFGAMVAVITGNILLTLPLQGLLAEREGIDFRSFVVGTLAVQIPMLVVLYGRLVAPGALSWRELGLRPLRLPVALGTGLLVGLASLTLSAVIGLLLTALGLAHNQVQAFSFVAGLEPAAFVVVLIGGAVLAPVVEELFFRGFLFGTYAARKPLWEAYLVSGLLFAVPHATPLLATPERIPGLIVAIFTLGTFLAWVYRRTGSLIPGMIGHGLQNGLGFVVLYLVPESAGL